MARFFLYQNVTRPTGDFPNPEEITVDKWYEPLSEPVKSKIAPALAIALIASGLFATQVPPQEDVTLDKWVSALSEPVRQKPGLAARFQDDLTWTITTPQIATTTLSSQVFFKRRLIYQSVAFTPQNIETITLDKWFAPLSEPVRSKPALRTGSQLTTVTDTDPIVSFSWFASLNEPKRNKPALLPASQQFFWISTDPVVSFGWHNWFNEPVRVKASLRFGNQQFFGTDTDPIVSFSWFANLGEPVRLKPGLRAGQQQDLSIAPTQPQVEVIYEDKWHFPWSEPTRRKPWTAFQSTDATPINFTVETITVDKWFAWLTEPVRSKPSLRTALHPAYQAPVLDPETQIIQGFESRWHQPWSTPIKLGRQLGAWQQQALSWDTSTPASVVTGSAVSSPIHFKRRFIYQSQAYTVFQPSAEVVTVDKWFELLSEPVRQKQGLASRYQITLAWSYFTPSETITPDKWFEPLSEPVRKKSGLPAPEQSDLAFYAQPTVTFSYFNGLNEPRRSKKGLPVQLQRAETASPQPVIPFSYYAWLTEPVRLKKGLASYEQQAVAAPPIFPNLLRTVPWFEPLNEPRWPKKGLKAHLQQTTVLGTHETSHVVFVTLDATETNGDFAEIYAVVYNRPVRAAVSIKEIPNGDLAYSSIEET